MNRRKSIRKGNGMKELRIIDALQAAADFQMPVQ